MTLWPCVAFMCTAVVIVGSTSFDEEQKEHCVWPNWLRCANGRCMSRWLVCDGDDDCGDNTDEENCEGDPKTINNTTCSTDQYKCRDNTCIRVEYFCDREFDCPDESDEYDGCTDQKQCPEFRCKNGYCIKQQWICDGFHDCEDFSDESDCDSRAIAPEKCTSSETNRFRCDHGRCISLNSTCNGNDDCGDNSDEDEVSCRSAEEMCIKGIGCSHICQKTPKGPMCSCPSGYELINNQTCTDIDECLENRELCDHSCVNNPGSYDCICEAGYELQEDKKTCKVEGKTDALMVFCTKKEIRGFYLESEGYFPLATNLQHALGVSMDANNVYWSDIKSGDEAIIRSGKDGTKREVIVMAGLGFPEDIAVDWITGNVYFTDSLWRRIGVCKNDGEFCAVIINESVDMPRGLALYPLNGEMFWSDFGRKPHISRAGMNGKDRKALVTDNLEWPNGLALDGPSRRLYWVDAKLQIIESIGLDGTDRRQVLRTSASHPYAIAVFGNKLYWSDWNSKTIQSADKSSGKNRTTLIREVDLIYDIHIYHPVMKPRVPNPCDSRPCSQLCLLGSNRTHSCACTLDKELSRDQRTCVSVRKRQHLVIASDDALIEYYHEILGKPRISRSLTSKRITHVAYDSTVGSVIVNDQTSNSLYRFDPINEEIQHLVNTSTQLLAGLDFDYFGNNIYWSDAQGRSIEIFSVRTGEKTVIRFPEEPLDILVTPEHASMYVVFKDEGKYRIDKLKMSGAEGRERVVENLLGPKISLAYDAESDRIFWSDEGTGRIEIFTLRTNDRFRFRTGLRGPVSLAVVDQELFWTLRDSKLLQWADKDNRVTGIKGVTLLVDGSAEIMHLVATGRLHPPNTHNCRTNNGGCSHVCLVAATDLNLCACPPGMALNPDNRTCSLRTVCASDEFRCSDTNQCIDAIRRCNGIQDCPNGEDEEKCEHIKTCGAGEFMCRNGQCIDSKKRCDSVSDCSDQADEIGCDKKDCKHDEFQCTDGQCITKFHVCDWRNDCSDFSDEINCQEHVCDPDSYRCASGSCIPKTWECDGDHDCQDGSDEATDRCSVLKCPREMFQCANKRCLDRRLVCDNIDDCGDSSDEAKCSDGFSRQDGPCPENSYKCRGTEKCISLKLRCNGEQDCPKNDDEHHCTVCEPDEFACDDTKCIDRSWVCDRVDDCGDNSDEINCDYSVNKKFDNTTISKPVDCEEFTCEIGGCLEFEKVCDGKHDCFDGSDEDGECSTACTNVDDCKQLCQKTPSGPVCLCKKGYSLESDGHSCLDIDECKLQICPQICHNQLGSFTCSCFEDFVLRSNRISCKVSGESMGIITATKSDIRKISPSLSSIEIIHRQQNVDVTGLDVDMKKKVVYWSNGFLGTLNRLNMETNEFKLMSQLGRPGVLAIDWATDNVYFHNGENPQTIKACNLEEQKCTQIVEIVVSAKIMSIAVDPVNGLLFWGQTTFGIFEEPLGEICRTDTSGSNRTIIARERIGIVSGITIDQRRSHLYWADASLELIERSDLDGNNRQTFLQHRVRQPVGINIYEDSVYWLMGTSGVLKKCRIYGDQACETISLGPSNVNQLFVISQTSRQPNVQNPCRDRPCEHMCVTRDQGHACLCANGLPPKLNSTCDNITMDGDDSVQFESSMLGMKHENVRTKGGLFTGIFITLLVAIGTGSSYYFYKKKKFGVRDSQDTSIYFQNPSYGRSCSPVLMNDYAVPVLPSSNHEYLNPMIEIQQPKVQKASIAGRKMFVVHSDDSDNESEKNLPGRNSTIVS